MSKNFKFIKEVGFEENYFANGGEHVYIDFLEGDVLRLTTNYVDQSLPNHSTFKPKTKPSNNYLISREAGKITFQTNQNRFEFDTRTFSLNIYNSEGSLLLESREEFIGFSGPNTIFQFYKDVPQPFWGFGSKTGPLNKENQITKMWNVDAVPDHPDTFDKDSYDPGYISIPFCISKVKEHFLGFFLDNPGQTFFNTGLDTNILKLVDQEIRPKFYFGSYSGECQVYIFSGKTLAEVVCKFAKLTGTADLPPIWSLGKHQCKFSYLNKEKIQYVIEKYQENEIPLDCIWMDIDYMNGFKSFSWDENNYGQKENLIDWIHGKDIKLVTIIDPGLKQEPGYFAYDQAKDKDLLCRTYGGREFVGHVWPGDTVFPDFSLINTRQWWAEKIAEYTKDGIDGIWIDMNDPATGSVDPQAMLFQKGHVEHQYYHNQYANLMAKGTKAGLLKSQANQRPFVLTRSAYVGIQNYSAVWTGDNCSNWEHLRMSIPQSLNLSLSGVSFNGADIGGFMGKPSTELIRRWYQASFLFPFFRNHDTKHTWHLMDSNQQEHSQEPYVYDPKTMENIKQFINLRYKFLPYLYNTFYSHTKTGDPILRPIFYNYDDPDYYSLSDQFMVGDSILQAPIVTPENSRKIYLPRGFWYDFLDKKWIAGNQTFEAQIDDFSTKIYIPDGAVIPNFKDTEFSNTSNLDWKSVTFNVYLKEKTETSYTYYQDDLNSYNYKSGQYSLTEIGVRKQDDEKLNIQKNILHDQFSGLDITESKFNLIN